MEMPDNELIVSLELEAKKHVPLDGTDAVVDFYHLGSHKDKLDQINVILATTTKNKISDHAQILKSSGFNAKTQHLTIAILTCMNIADELFQEKEWHDSYVWDMVRTKHFAQESFFNYVRKDFEHIRGHPWPHTYLANWMIHLKGKKRKDKRNIVDNVMLVEKPGDRE